MVVGAYTILNTVGLLVGLPITISNTNFEPEYDINNNFAYYLNDNKILLDNTFIICEFENSVSNIPDYQNNLTLDIRYNSINYQFHSKSIVDNRFVVYQLYTTVTDWGDPKNNVLIDFSTVSLGSNTYQVNNVYIATLTSSLSPINGDSIISSITSGLGLMGDITTNFKNGFSALIWNSEKNTLTTFGNFALIFLGVSITFAIVKLCLNLIRSKTGA